MLNGAPCVWLTPVPSRIPLRPSVRRGRDHGRRGETPSRLLRGMRRGVVAPMNETLCSRGAVAANRAGWADGAACVHASCASQRRLIARMVHTWILYNLLLPRLICVPVHRNVHASCTARRPLHLCKHLLHACIVAGCRTRWRGALADA